MTGNKESLGSSAGAGSIGGRFVSVVVVLLVSIAGGLFVGLVDLFSGKADLAPVGTIMGALVGGAAAIAILYRRGAWN